MDRRWPRALLAAAVGGLSGCATMSDRRPWPTQPHAHPPGIHAASFTAAPDVVASGPLFVAETAALEAFPFPQETADPQTAEAYRQRALVENRAVQAARAKVDALGAAVAASSPTPSSANPASCQLNQALQELAEAETHAAVGVKRACADIALGQRLIDVVEDQRKAVIQARDAVRQRSKGNGAADASADPDLLRFEVAIARLDQKSLEAERIREQGRAALAECIHAAPGSPLAVLARDPVAEARIVCQSGDAVMQAAVQDNRGLQARAVAAASHRARLDHAFLHAQKKGEASDHAIADPDVYAAQGLAWTSAFDYEAARDNVLQTVHKLIRQSEGLVAELELIRRVDQPKSRQAFGLAVDGYAKSKGSADSLIDALDDRFESRVNEVRLEHELTQTLAALEQALGRPLPGEPVAAATPPAQAPAPGPKPPDAPSVSAPKREAKPKSEMKPAPTPPTSRSARNSAAKPAPSASAPKPNSASKPATGAAKSSSAKPQAAKPPASAKPTADPKAKAEASAKDDDELPMEAPILPPLSPARPEEKPNSNPREKSKPAGATKPSKTGRHQDEERDFSARPSADRSVIAASATLMPDPDEGSGNAAVPFPS